jgi:phenylacetate-CoA ligase
VLTMGAERKGASVIPIHGGNTKRQLQIMKDLDHMLHVPSYAFISCRRARGGGIKREG